jgi:Flp pilus assembly protein TadB
VTAGLLLGCAFGAALCLLVLVLVPPRPALASVVGRWERQRARQTAASWLAGADDSNWQGHLGRFLVTKLAQHGITLGKLRTNLELTDHTLEGHLGRKCSYGLLGLLLPAVMTLLMLSVGVTPPLSLPAFGGLALGALFFWVPDLSVVQAAEQRRHELRRALSCYLDLVAMSLAGGRGIPESLPACARIGQGWAFELLQDTIDRARRVGDTPWAALAHLGERTGMQELQDLGGALLLVADDGAKVRASLTARASTQRRRQLAEAEGAASKADQTIQMAQVVLAAGFFLFLGYPAVVAVMGV